MKILLLIPNLVLYLAVSFVQWDILWLWNILLTMPDRPAGERLGFLLFMIIGMIVCLPFQALINIFIEDHRRIRRYYR